MDEGQDFCDFFTKNSFVVQNLILFTAWMLLYIMQT